MKLVWVMKYGVAACSMAIASTVCAEEGGKELYMRSCVACHGQNGEGAGNGTFPPLSKSEWLAGPADRAIQILLHGLVGEVEVKGKTYNLAMPPQGGLTDAEVAKVLTYVRSNFSNKESAVTEEQVVAARKKSADQSEPWKADDLLKLHPLPEAKGVLKNLIMYVYDGKWESLPNFSQLEPEAVEEEQYGLFSLRNVAKKQQFGVVWEGEIVVPETADYGFEILVDDGARLSVAGNEVLESDVSEAKGEWRIAKVRLKKGLNPIKLEYFQLGGAASVQVRWFGPGIARKQLLTDKPKGRKKKAPLPVIDLSPKGDEAALYNNFIAGTTARAIGVGYPGEMNLAFSYAHCAPELIWRGKFISGGRHWTARGQGAEKPLAKEVVNLSKTPPYRLSEGGTFDWSKPSPLEYRGYKLDEKRYPTFVFSIGRNLVQEMYEPRANGIRRTLNISSEEGGKLALVLAQNAKPSGDTELELDGKLGIQAPAKIKKGPEGYYTTLSLNKGTNTFTFDYTWH